MAAPAATTRQTPTGIKLKDGHSTKITLKRYPAISFWEKAVTPPGIDGGEAVDQTTMHNNDWRTRLPRELKTLTDITVRAAYDPVVYDQIEEAININDEITVRFPDGTTIAFWGFLRSFQPGDNVEGTQPEATIMITPTNLDDDGAEQGPVVVQVAGT